MTAEKQLRTVTGTSLEDGAPFHGYEMHVGDTDGPDVARPLLRFDDGRVDGAVSVDGRVAGTYVHGFFADDRLRAGWLRRLGARAGAFSYEAAIDETLDRLAAHLARHVDCDRLLAISETAGQRR
jgi:adenosylcobyric acid synthase